MKLIFLIIENFYAAIETELNPRLTGLPIVITHEGTVVGVSKGAKTLCRIKPGVSEAQAREDFPQLTFIEGDMPRYCDCSRKIADRLRIIAYEVGEFKPGAFILNIEGCPFNRWEREKKESVLFQLIGERNFRAGQADSLEIARLAAQKAETNSLLTIPAGEEEIFLGGLPLSSLPLGEFGIRNLKEMGIARIGDLLTLPPPVLRELLGKDAARILNFARGNFRQSRGVVEKLSRKIRFSRNGGAEIAEFNRALVSLVQEMLYQRVKASAIFIGLKYTDGVTVAKKLKLSLTRDEVELSRAKDFLLAQIWKRRLRLETGMMELAVEADNGQVSLFSDARREKVADSVHNVRNVYGENAVRYAVQL